MKKYDEGKQCFYTAVEYHGSEKKYIIDGSMLQWPIQNLWLPLEGQNSIGQSDGLNHT